MIVTGRHVPAAEANTLGILDAVVSDDASKQKLSSSRRKSLATYHHRKFATETKR